MVGGRTQWLGGTEYSQSRPACRSTVLLVILLLLLSSMVLLVYLTKYLSFHVLGNEGQYHAASLLFFVAELVFLLW